MSTGRRGGRTWNRKVCPKKRKKWTRWGSAKCRSRRVSCRFSQARRRGRKVLVNRHHMTPESRGGRTNRRNILWMRIDRHIQLHYYFGDLRWENITDIIFFGEYWKMKRFRSLSRAKIGEAFESIFGLREPSACVRLMDRISRAKGRTVRNRHVVLMAA